MMQSYLSDRIFMDNPSNRPTSSNPVFYRLDARNPRQYCIRPTYFLQVGRGGTE